MEVTEDFVKEQQKHFKPDDEDAGLLEACSKNPVIFADKLCGVKMYAWQAYVISQIEELKNQKRIFTVITSRQIGKTEAESLYALWAAIFNKFPGGNENATTVGIVAAQASQATQVISRIKNKIKIADSFIEDKYQDENGNCVFGEDPVSSLISDDREDPNNQTTITFDSAEEHQNREWFLKGSKTGSQIQAHPPTNSVVGKTFTLLFIDEAGITDKITEEFFHEKLKPTTSSTHAPIILFSTPWEPHGVFYRFVNPDGTYESRDDVVSFTFTVDAIRFDRPEWYEEKLKELERAKKDGRKTAVQKAYYCKFVKDEDTYFNPELVRDVFVDYLEKKGKDEGPCDMGVDFGGQQTSKSVITVSRFDEENEIVERIYHKSYQPGEDETLVRDIEDIRDRFNVQRITVDKCPAAEYIIREMKNRGWNINPMVFRKEKVPKYSEFRSMLNKGKIKSYPDDELQKEMMALEHSPGRSRTRIGAPDGYNDDLTDSFLMSAYYYIQTNRKSGVVDMEEYMRKREQKRQKYGNDNPLDRIRRKRRSSHFDSFEEEWDI